jgi:hypothetical protein
VMPYLVEIHLQEVAVRQIGEAMIVGIDHVQLAMPAGREDVAPNFTRAPRIPEVPKPPALAKRGAFGSRVDRSRSIARRVGVPSSKKGAPCSARPRLARAGPAAL